MMASGIGIVFALLSLATAMSMPVKDPASFVIEDSFICVDELNRIASLEDEVRDLKNAFRDLYESCTPCAQPSFSVRSHGDSWNHTLPSNLSSKGEHVQIAHGGTGSWNRKTDGVTRHWTEEGNFTAATATISKATSETTLGNKKQRLDSHENLAESASKRMPGEIVPKMRSSGKATTTIAADTIDNLNLGAAKRSLLSVTCAGTEAIAGSVLSAQKISESDGNFPYSLSDNSWFGYSVATIGDLNNDGVPDVVVTGEFYSDGAVFVIFMEASGKVNSAQKISASYGSFPYSTFGEVTVASLGDLDLDGVEDIAIGTYYDSDQEGVVSGAVYILNLRSDGQVKSAQKISASYGSFPYSLAEKDYFGSALASVGDLNDDGVVDIVVGAKGDDDGGAEAGAMYVLFMQSDGQVKSAQKISNSYGDFPYELDLYSNFPSGLASLGDLDGDGVPDIAAGQIYDDDGGASTGAVYVLFMQPDGKVKSSSKISNSYGNFPYQLEGYSYFGYSVTAIFGDINGDGINDIAVGAPSDGGGGVHIVFMRSDGQVEGAQKISNSYGNFPYSLEDDYYFGSSLSSGEDFDGDGVNELIVGAWYKDGNLKGAVYTLHLNVCLRPTSTPTTSLMPTLTPIPTPYPTSMPTLTLRPTHTPTLYCEAGTFLNSTTTSCEACEPGKWSSDEAGQCMDCVPGRYTNHSKSSFCQVCKSGYYQQLSASRSCEACVAGKYNNASGSEDRSSCKICPSGKYAASTGASFCTTCDSGRYLLDDGSDVQDHDEAFDCRECAAGKVSSNDFSTCDDCGAVQSIHIPLGHSSQLSIGIHLTPL